MLNNYIQISLANVGKLNPYSIEEYQRRRGFEAIKKVLKTGGDWIIDEIQRSGLRGRGGAGFPSGLKQKYTRTSCEQCPERYVVCNADEGEPGTYKDRMIMENDPYLLVEGILIAAFAISASKAFIYIRGEYYDSIRKVEHAINECYKHGWLGKNIQGSSFSIDMEVFYGAGSYLCGEELTLIESLEGRRGYPRIKPPFPAEKGLFGKPTLINNVETFSHLPFIIREGADKYASIGTPESKGTKLFCVSGNVKKPGTYELPMGITLKELIVEVCGGMMDGYEFTGALLGGAAGTFVDKTFFDVPLAYETLKQKGATLGSGAVIVIDHKTNLKNLLTNILEFFKHESCGKCVPCRIGTTLIYEKSRQKLSEEDLVWLEYQTSYMAHTSLCPLGQSPILPVHSVIKYFKNQLID